LQAYENGLDGKLAIWTSNEDKGALHAPREDVKMIFGNYVINYIEWIIHNHCDMSRNKWQKTLWQMCMVAVTVTVTSCDPVENGCGIPY
jgi:hypothetical protein